MEKKPHLCKVFKCTKINKTAAKPIINALLKFYKKRELNILNTKIYCGDGLIWNLHLGTGLIILQN